MDDIDCARECLKLRDVIWRGSQLRVFAATGGRLKLYDPERRERVYKYGGVGIGIGFPIKIPLFGQCNTHNLNLKPYGKDASGTFGPEQAPNTGQVYILDSFQGSELTSDDITGGALTGEISVYVGAGVGVQALLLGCNSGSLTHALRSVRNLTSDTIDQLPPFNALLLVEGTGGGVVSGVGGSACAGYVG